MQFVPRELSANAPDFRAVEKITAAAFGQRRKMVRTTLKDHADKFGALEIDPTSRAENLSVQNFLDLLR